MAPTHDVEELVTKENPAQERETSTEHKVLADGDYEPDYLFFGTFRSLIRRSNISSDIAHKTAQETAGNQVINQEEREAPIQEKKLEDVGVATQSSADEQQESDDAQIATSNQETAAGEELNQEEKEDVVSALQNCVENPQKPTNDVEEGSAQESEAEEKETLDNEQQKSSDDRETTDRKVVTGGEGENQELATAAVIRQQVTQVQKIAAEEVREEEISFEGKNYDDHFPKIERRAIIRKRERRGDFRR